MELFRDGEYVRLRNRMHGASYLHADEDGAGVSLSRRRASVNTAWVVHRVGGDYMLLHSAAYGGYLALSPQQVSLVYAGHAAVQAAYDDPEQGHVLWEAVRVGDEAGDDVLMLHVSNRLLRAAPWNPVLGCPVYVDMDNAGTMMHWAVDPIPLRQAPPVLPRPTELPRGVVLRRTIIYMRANDQGMFDPLDRRTYAFSGRSWFHLKGDLANQLREKFHQITLCVRAGSLGRLTPLVIDLPADEHPMEIVVFTAGSEVNSCIGSPSGLAMCGFDLHSKIAVEDIDEMRIFLADMGSEYFCNVFEECIQRVDLTQLTQKNSYRNFLGTPLEQTVPNTCAIVSSTVCVEVHHRWEYETLHGLRTFPCIAAAPRKLRSACRRDLIWTPKGGAYVGAVLEMIKHLGGVRTTNAPTPAPSFLPLHSWQCHSWDTEDGLTADRIIELLDTRGPFVGTLWVCPWYHLFDAEKDKDLVYRSGCARNLPLQEWSEDFFGKELVGLHSVLCFEYRVRSGQLDVLILDNHAHNGPERWIHYYELEEVHTISVERMDPSLHLGKRTITYPQSKSGI